MPTLFQSIGSQSARNRFALGRLRSASHHTCCNSRALPQCALLGGLLFDPTTSLVTGGPQPFELIMFVFLYLLGLSLLVASTLFWESPMAQCRNMLKGGKIFATIIFLLTGALLVVVVVIPAASKIEAVFKVPAMCALMVIQAIVFVWYLLATIPSAYCTRAARVLAAGASVRGGCSTPAPCRAARICCSLRSFSAPPLTRPPLAPATVARTFLCQGVKALCKQ